MGGGHNSSMSTTRYYRTKIHSAGRLGHTVPRSVACGWRQSSCSRAGVGKRPGMAVTRFLDPTPELRKENEKVKKKKTPGAKRRRRNRVDGGPNVRTTSVASLGRTGKKKKTRAYDGPSARQQSGHRVPACVLHPADAAQCTYNT